MTVEEASHRLVQEMRRVLPNWQNSISKVDDPKNLEAMFWALTRKDVEVEVALKDLIEAIMEEQDG